MSARCVIVLLSLAPALLAQDRPPVAHVAVVDKPPSIDGKLDDDCWRSATPIGPLRQMSPLIDVPATEDTEVRLLRDADNLYIGVRCHDRDAAGIVATQMGRDADIEPDDRIVIVFDTFRDRRNGYYFAVAPAGAMVDALLTRDGQNQRIAWDGIWSCVTSIDESGWTAEFAIPFRTLAFTPDSDTWGFNIGRVIKRRLESDRWAGLSRDQEVTQVSAAGAITGLRGAVQGVGLDIVPSFAAHLQNDNVNDDASLIGKPDLDAFYRLTPSLQASLTINTDFANTEADDRRVNLTRFPLFFPEKRAFFLQDAGVFDFADLDDTLVPFFSRRIGLATDGTPVPILVGGRLTGHQDDWNIGSLVVETDSKLGIPGQTLAAARVSRNVGEQSTIGAIFTHGDPTGAADNDVFGLDANFRTDSFLGGKNLTASVFGLKSETPGARGDDLAYGASLGYPNDLWSWKVSARTIEGSFHPALGFVLRQGVREYVGRVQFEPRIDQAIRRLEFSADVAVVTGTDGGLQTWYSEVKLLGLVWDAGDELRFIVRQSRDVLDVPFTIHQGIDIAPGQYDAVRPRIEAESALKRPVSAVIGLEGGRFYDGTRFEVDSQLDWRASRHLHFGVQYEFNDVDLDAGSFATHVARVHADIYPSPAVSLRNFVQYDNESGAVGINSRFRWTIAPGRDLYLDFSETALGGGGSFVPQQEVLAMKIAYTLRF